MHISLVTERAQLRACTSVLLSPETYPFTFQNGQHPMMLVISSADGSAFGAHTNSVPPAAKDK